MYGGTKEEMQRLLSDAEKLTGKKYNLSSYADIVKAIHAIQTEMGITGTTAKEAEHTIEGSIASTKAAWENVLTAIGSGKGVKDATKKLAKSAKNVIRNTLPVIKNALKGIGTLVVELAPEIARTIPKLATMLVPSAIGLVKSIGSNIVKAMPNMLGNATANIAKLIASVTGGKSSDIYKAMMKVVNPIRWTFEKIIAKIREFWDVVVKPILGDIGRFIVDKVVPGVQQLYFAFKPIWDDVSPKISEAFTAIAGFWNNTLYPAINALWDYTVNKVVPAITSAWKDTFKPAVKKVFAAVKNLWENTLKPALKDMYDFIYRDMIPTLIVWWEYHLWPAIDNVFKWIKGAWEEYGKPTFDAVKTVVEGLVAFLTGAFFGDWESAWQGLGKAAFAPFQWLAEVFSEPINAIIDILNSFFASVQGPINKFIGFINNIGRHLPAMDLSEYGMPGLQKWTDIPTSTWENIPKISKGGGGAGAGRRMMANGGILGEGERAIVGEYAPEFLTVKNGRAVVTPMNVRGAGVSGGHDINIYLEMDGMQFARAVYKANNDEIQRVGVQLSGVNA